MDKYFLTLDAGTGSIRACLFNGAGELKAFAARDFIHLSDPRYPGSMDFNCEKNWALAKETIAECLKKTGVGADSIAAAATGSMREGIVLYDKTGKEIFACANVDSRAKNEAALLRAMDPGLEKRLYALSGQTFSLGAAARLLWIKNNLPRVYGECAKVSMLNDWLNFKLTGQIVGDPSNGATTGFFDVLNRRYSAGALRECGLKDDIIPPVVECGEKIGRISAECARETGLSQKTAVAQGGGDAQLGVLGLGLSEAGDFCVLGGSFWQAELNADKPVMDEQCRVRVNPHAVRDMWQYEAIAFYPGLIMKWFKNTFCENEVAAEAGGGETAYARMDRMAETVPPASNGIVCAFSNVMDYLSWRHAPAAFLNFSFDGGVSNRASFYRAIMENAAFVTKGNARLIERISGVRPKRVTFGGGASKSPLWAGILADVLGVPVHTPEVTEATSYGALFCAMLSCGHISNINEAKSFVREKAVFEPNAANAAAYGEAYAKWRAVYAEMLKIADNGILPHMWAAP